MTSILIGFYLFCQLFLFCLFGYFIIKRQIEIEKENLAMMATMFAFGPLGVFAFLCVVAHEKVQEGRRLLCQRAMSKWENKARESIGEKDLWDWQMNKQESEARYNALRETIECLTSVELELLVKVSENAFTLEQPLKDAVMDEIIHREIMKE